MNAGVGIYEDALGGEALRAVAGDSVPVIKVTVFLGVEFTRRLLSRRAVMGPSDATDSMTARSRLAVPSDLSGAVNWMRSPAENSCTKSRYTLTPVRRRGS